ncbi:MAG: HEPN domain-containing protein [Pseudonocardiaceae bacterium]
MTLRCPPRLAAFLAHLTAEKALKGALIARGIAVRKIHDLVELQSALIPADAAAISSQDRLAPSAIRSRIAVWGEAGQPFGAESQSGDTRRQPFGAESRCAWPPHGQSDDHPAGRTEQLTDGRRWATGPGQQSVDLNPQ